LAAEIESARYGQADDGVGALAHRRGFAFALHHRDGAALLGQGGCGDKTFDTRANHDGIEAVKRHTELVSSNSSDPGGLGFRPPSTLRRALFSKA
jgi:hypothetical protein